MSETRRSGDLLWRLARKPNPWAAPDWAFAQDDGTFGNRFDDPSGMYRVIYASSSHLGCYIETLAPFRPDLTLLAELNEIEGENDYYPLGTVPPEWLQDRLMGSARLHDECADLHATGWVSTLRQLLASECLKLGLPDLDLSALHLAHRRLTQLVSRIIYEFGQSGICYSSRYGNNLENWALFEPFNGLHPVDSQSLNRWDPSLVQACQILGITFGD